MLRVPADKRDDPSSLCAILGTDKPNGGLSLGTILLSPRRSNRDHAKAIHVDIVMTVDVLKVQ